VKRQIANIRAATSSRQMNCNYLLLIMPLTELC